MASPPIDRSLLNIPGQRGIGGEGIEGPAGQRVSGSADSVFTIVSILPTPSISPTPADHRNGLGHGVRLFRLGWRLDPGFRVEAGD